MTTARIQVLSTERKQGVGKKSGNAYDMTICQCIIHGEEIKIGELVLPRDHVAIEPGLFDGEFGLAVDQQTKRIGGVLIKLTPVPRAAAPKAS